MELLKALISILNRLKFDAIILYTGSSTAVKIPQKLISTIVKATMIQLSL